MRPSWLFETFAASYCRLMKIAHVIDYFQPQFGYQETYLARQQLAEGHDVCVFTSERFRPIFYNGGGAQNVLGERIQRSGNFVEEGIRVCRLDVAFEINERIWLKHLIPQLATFAPDAIHVHGFATFTSYRVAKACQTHPALKKATLLVDDHMYPQVSRGAKQVFYGAIKTFLTPTICQSATHLVAVSTPTRDFMRDQYGVSPDQVKVIYLGVDDELFAPNNEVRQKRRAELGVSAESTLCLYTGKIMARKQIDLLITAFARLAQSHPTLRLLLVGYADEAYKAQLQAQVAQAGLSERVLWRPTASQAALASYMVAADMAVWPAEHSISFVEGMACGLPIIVCNEPRSREDVQYNNGFAFESGNVDELTRCLEMLVSDEKLRLEMGQRGRQTVEQTLSWARINQQFMALYQKPVATMQPVA